jgi:hypothetical protein
MAITPAERLNQFIADDRIVRGKEHGLWRDTDKQGRETASLLAAFAEGIDDASKLPAEYPAASYVCNVPSARIRSSIEISGRKPPRRRICS